ncbi:MAG TPA: ABC transporter permease [Terracidiphilus sp.]|jgi:lipopolysaccharide transport system permease protein
MTALSALPHVPQVGTVIIRGEDSSWSLQPRELWRHRELLYFLTWRDIKVRYKQTVLGLAWAVIQPLAIALTLSLFLGNLVRVPSEGLPYPLFAYSAMVIWQLFANALTESSNSLLANERLITKVYFPRLIAPLSSVLASLIDFAISLLVLAFFLIYYRIVPTERIVTLPLVALLAVLIALGVGLWLAALNVKYRDVRYVVGFLVQFWFLASPIAYPASVVPERWRVWYGLNPMVGVVEGFRWTLRGTGAAPLSLLAISACVAMAILIGGTYYFRRTEDTFADFI